MIWNGKKEVVIGEVDEQGNVIREFRVQPGEEIPLEAERLLAESESVTPIPYDSNKGYTTQFVVDAYRSGDPDRHLREPHRTFTALAQKEKES